MILMLLYLFINLNEIFIILKIKKYEENIFSLSVRFLYMTQTNNSNLQIK